MALHLILLLLICLCSQGSTVRNVLRGYVFTLHYNWQNYCYDASAGNLVEGAV